MIRGIGTVVSPVYGGITANAEFEVLASIIPYQHYLGYLTDAALLAPRPDLSALRIRALHNGIGSNDPRLHQVPFLAASNTRADDGLRQKLEGLPLFCFPRCSPNGCSSASPAATSATNRRLVAIASMSWNCQQAR